MSKTRIESSTEAEFFARGKRLARLVDRGETLAESHLVTFDDPAEVEQLRALSRMRRRDSEQLQAPLNS